MKPAVFLVVSLLAAAPAHAQLGSILNKANKAVDKANDLNITEQEERTIGENASASLREKFGVYQDQEVTRYVALVGGVLARESTRPNLKWTFIVLDTDAVNAFAAPGGLIHVTRGLLGLAKNEAELAGVLGHEITHVTAKHTIKYLQQQKGITAGADIVGGASGGESIVAKRAERVYHFLLDGTFSQSDEMEADRVGVRLAAKLGYAPRGLADVLEKLASRNSGRQERNGLFASHPATQDRIEKIESLITGEGLKGSATVASRYEKFISFDAKPLGEVAIASNIAGASGLAGDGGKPAKKDDEKQDGAKKEEPKKKGGLLGKFITSTSEQKQSSQTTASAGSRGVGSPDRDAKGGPNKTLVAVTLTPADLDTFKKGIGA